MHEVLNSLAEVTQKCAVSSLALRSPGPWNGRLAIKGTAGLLVLHVAGKHDRQYKFYSIYMIIFLNRKDKMDPSTPLEMYR